MTTPVLDRFDSLMPVRRKAVAVAFAEVLYRARRRMGLSQEALAHGAGVDRTYPSLLERGLRTPSLTQLLNLAPSLLLQPGRLVEMTASRLGRGATLSDHSANPDTLARVFVNMERLRVERDITVAQLADRTGLDRADLLQLQQRGLGLTIARLDVLARGLDCDVIDLLMRTP